ncbi:hypothetical protein RIF29_17100 [Crotalaria pallida]|uniref:Uncharacterized protein n=1 Tax=Crotalaria pallida TaxID=3830 RepID=A0AAN9FGG5_CROPI
MQSVDEGDPGPTYPSDKGIKPHVVLESRDERTYLSPYSMAILIGEVVLWCLMGLFGPVGLTWLLEDKKDDHDAFKETSFYALAMVKAERLVPRHPQTRYRSESSVRGSKDVVRRHPNIAGASAAQGFTVLLGLFCRVVVRSFPEAVNIVFENSHSTRRVGGLLCAAEAATWNQGLPPPGTAARRTSVHGAVMDDCGTERMTMAPCADEESESWRPWLCNVV